MVAPAASASTRAAASGIFSVAQRNTCLPFMRGYCLRSSSISWVMRVGDEREEGASIQRSVGAAAVGVEVEAEDAAALPSSVGAEHHGAGAVAEEHRHVAARVGEVEARGVHLRADEEHAAVHARADPRVGDGEPVEEARALVADVERGDAREPELGLEEARRSRGRTRRARASRR